MATSKKPKLTFLGNEEAYFIYSEAGELVTHGSHGSDPAYLLTQLGFNVKYKQVDDDFDPPLKLSDLKKPLK